MLSDFEPPQRGVIFWPVGTGDSTTVVLNPDTVVQIDLHHEQVAEDDEDPRVPIVDELVALLPEGDDGRPYLAAFGATHLDEDHVKGFAELLDRVNVGDLWFTPRVLWAQDQDELCEDAKAFVEEAERRIENMKEHGDVGSGDRIRIFGFSDDLAEHKDIYKNLPEGSVTVPGSEFHSIDGVDRADVFRAFVHAPFKEDAEAERNDTSFALQITLTDGEESVRALLFGDLSYSGVKRIFERSEADDLAWDLFLAPHHCSKSLMYGKDDGESEDTLKQQILDDLEGSAIAGAYIVVSSGEIPATDEPGANPPHRIAANHYEEVVDAGHFLVTDEHAPDPLVFELDTAGYVLLDASDVGDGDASTVAKAAAAASGTASAGHTSAVGFG
ncbi:MAG: hypothetical protein ABSG93_01135 [Solirubrobacteraceae bacterium]